MIPEKRFHATIRRLFIDGLSGGYPKRREDQDVLLGAAFLSLDPDRQYEETDLNLALRAWIAGMELRGPLDHVALRRALVDRELLLRDKAGQHYQPNRERWSAMFEPAVAASRPAEIAAEARAERIARRLAWENRQPQ